MPIGPSRPKRQMRREMSPGLTNCFAFALVRYTADSVVLVAIVSTLLSSNLGNILVDAVERL